jgi:acetolactate synthase I/II/III large subunit
VNLAAVDNPLQVMKKMFSGRGPRIIDVPIHFAENVFPMVPPGAANRDMIGPKPPVLREQLLGT